MVMYAGQLSEKAAAETIIREPRHPYTKMLIAALPRSGCAIVSKFFPEFPANRRCCWIHPQAAVSENAVRQRSANACKLRRLRRFKRITL